jgi:hypothetical protein
MIRYPDVIISGLMPFSMINTEAASVVEDRVVLAEEIA